MPEGVEAGNGLLDKVDDAWRDVLMRQGGIYAMLRVVKNDGQHYLPFITDSSATERLYEAGEMIVRKHPDYPRFLMQPPQHSAEYPRIKQILEERVFNGSIKELVILYEPGLTQSLKIKK